MNVTEIVINDRVLIQTDEFTKETGRVKAILDNGRICVDLQSGKMDDFAPQYILKSFGQ